MFKKYIYLFSSFLLLLFLIPAAASALEARGAEKISYSNKDIFHGNTYLAGSTVNFGAKVKGDLFVGGSEIDLDGAIIEGDLYIAGANITIRDIQAEDVRIAGANINIKNAKISGDLMIGGAQVDIDEDSSIDGSLYVGVSVLTLSGSVGEDAKIAGEKIIIDNIIGGDLFVRANSLYLKGNTEILGDASYKYGKDGEKANIDSGAILSSKLEQGQIVIAKSQIRYFPRVTDFIYSLLMYLVLGLVFVLLTPIYIRKSAEFLEKKPWKTLGIGALILFISPLALIILLLTLLGAPLAMIGFGIYFILIYIAKIFVGTYLGMKILKNQEKKPYPIWEMALGVTILSILGIIPYVGPWIRFAIILFGLGMIWIRSFEVYKEMRAKEQI